MWWRGRNSNLWKERKRLRWKEVKCGNEWKATWGWEGWNSTPELSCYVMSYRHIHGHIYVAKKGPVVRYLTDNITEVMILVYFLENCYHFTYWQDSPDSQDSFLRERPHNEIATLGAVAEDVTLPDECTEEIATSVVPKEEAVQEVTNESVVQEAWQVVNENFLDARHDSWSADAWLVSSQCFLRCFLNFTFFICFKRWSNERQFQIFGFWRRPHVSPHLVSAHDWLCHELAAEKERRGAQESNSEQDGSLWSYSHHAVKSERSLHSFSHSRPGVIPSLCL